MQHAPSAGLFGVAYIDGADFNPSLAGVFFEIRPSGRGLACDGAHPESLDHFAQYSPAERSSYCRQAVAAVLEGDSHLYDSEGNEVSRTLC